MQVIKLLLSTPLMWVLYLLLAGIVLLHGACWSSRRTRYGWYALTLGTLLLGLLSFSPLSHALTRSLELRYETPSAETLASLEAIVILGGGGRGGRPSSATYRRVTEGVQMFKASGAKRMILQGAAEVQGEPTDAEVMRQFALAQGVDVGQIMIDPNSRTTEEHPAQLAPLLPTGTVRIGIVTSTLHMPRTMRIFERQFSGKTLIPIPVDRNPTSVRYASHHLVPSVDALLRSTAALHEWIGIMWYALR